MKKALLSAAALVAVLALPGSPALAQTNEITIGISISTTGPAAALGIPERNALDFVPKEIGGVPLKLLVLHAADHRGLYRGQRSRHSAFRAGAVPDQRGAHEVVGRPAAVDSDHGQGAVRAHEGEQHQDRRLYRLF